MTAAGWRENRAATTAEHLLDSAATLFERDGVASTGMTEIARTAGCSRATLYRYFPTAESLRSAYVEREARRVAHSVASAVANIAEPRARATAAVIESLARVRANAQLAAWFRQEDQGLTHAIALSSDVVGSDVAQLLRGPVDSVDTRWVVRVIVSLLMSPAASAEEEQQIVERFVVDPIMADSGAGIGS